jgi:iron complex transport system ATP-binding protein
MWRAILFVFTAAATTPNGTRMKLELQNAGLQFDGRWIVRGLSLALRSGTLLALIGPNGSGKSTMLRLLGGLWRTSEGAALLDGKNLNEFSRRALARCIAYTPQDTHLDFAFSVREVVMMGRHAHLGRFQPEGDRDRAAVQEAMQRADVAELAERVVTELSGGERQRVLIARSLATEAPIILLDEPTANLDIAHALDVLALCRALVQAGKAIAIALHDLNHAARFADEVALLHHGSLMAAGSVEDVLLPAAIGEIFSVSVSRVAADTGTNVFLFDRN